MAIVRAAVVPDPWTADEHDRHHDDRAAEARPPRRHDPARPGAPDRHRPRPVGGLLPGRDRAAATPPRGPGRRHGRRGGGPGGVGGGAARAPRRPPRRALPRGAAVAEPRGAGPRPPAPGRHAHADRRRLRPRDLRGDLPARPGRQRHRARGRPAARRLAEARDARPPEPARPPRPARARRRRRAGPQRGRRDDRRPRPPPRERHRRRAPLLRGRHRLRDHDRDGERGVRLGRRLPPSPGLQHVARRGGAGRPGAGDGRRAAALDGHARRPRRTRGGARAARPRGRRSRGARRRPARARPGRHPASADDRAALPRRRRDRPPVAVPAAALQALPPQAPRHVRRAGRHDPVHVRPLRAARRGRRPRARGHRRHARGARARRARHRKPPGALRPPPRAERLVGAGRIDLSHPGGSSSPPDTTAPAPRLGGRAQVVLILGALSSFSPLSIDMYLPGLPGIGCGFDALSWAVQLTLTACLAGLALGQILAGPLSDRFGRRGPLLVGVAAYAVVSALCALAPSIAVLVVLRFAQGLAGAAGIVIARAVVRDMHSGVAAARFFSLLMLVNGLAPILAPVIGGQVLTVTSWRGVFVVLSAVGALLFLATATGLRETLPVDKRHPGGIAETLLTFGRLLGDRTFLGHALACGLSFGAMFAYIAGSPFVLQDIYGASPQLYSVMFAGNALGLVAASQANRALLARFEPLTILRAALSVQALGAVALLVVVAAGTSVWGIVALLFVVVASLGLVFPNATALALADHPRVAGSASGLLGVMQFIVGAAAAPLVGAGGADTAAPGARAIAVLGVGGVLSATVLASSAEHRRDVRPATSGTL